jgi:ATP-dependent Clp protease adaptor protein ClpS
MKPIYAVYSPETEQEDVLLLDEQVSEQFDLILYNDEFNTFEWVIESLVKICRHDPLQAEQCAHLVHFTGKCGVKRGTFKDLRPMCEALLDRGLSAKIE